MATAPSKSTQAEASESSPDPTSLLEPGDHLIRPEFEPRYNAMIGEKKAELIDGVVHMPSPVRHERHGQPHLFMMGRLATYQAGTLGFRPVTMQLCD